MSAEPTMSVGISDQIARLPLSEDLLQYYRDRLETAEEERAHMIESLKICDVKHSDMHQLQWMLSEREEEVLTLQHAAKAQQLQVIEQQEQLLELQAENRQLRIQEAEDRKRIQQLLSLTKPVQQEVTFMRDVRPTKLTTTPSDDATRVVRQYEDGQSVEVVCPGSMGAPQVSKGRTKSAVQTRQPASKDEGPVATRVLRTVYLPSEKTDSMLLTIDALQRELDEHRRVGDEKMAIVMEQRDTAIAECKVQTERLLERVREADERTTTLSTLLRNNEREYLLLRHNTAVGERVMKEDNAALQEQNSVLLSKSEEDKARLEEEHQQFAEELGRQTETYVQTFRAHATAREKERDDAHAEMKKAKLEHEQEEAALEQRISKMAQKITRLDKVRKLSTQQKKWEASQQDKPVRTVELRPGRGGTASRATLLYDRFTEGVAAEIERNYDAKKSQLMRERLELGLPVDVDEEVLVRREPNAGVVEAYGASLPAGQGRVSPVERDPPHLPGGPA